MIAPGDFSHDWWLMKVLPDSYINDLITRCHPWKVGLIDRDAIGWCVELLDAHVHDLCCSVCQKVAVGYDHLKSRTVRDIDFDGQQVRLKCRAPRVECSADGVQLAMQDLFRSHSRFTRAFEDSAVLQILDSDSKSALARRLSVSRNTLDRSLREARINLQTKPARN